MLWLFYVLLGIAIAAHEFLRSKKSYIDYLTIFNLYFFVYYVIPGAVINYADDYVSRYQRYLITANGTYSAFFMVVLSYVMVCLGYKGLKSKQCVEPIYIRKIRNESGFFRSMMWVLFGVGLLSFFAYAIMYGGIVSLLTNSALIRDNSIELVKGSNSIEFIGRFIVCLQFYAYFVYADYMSKRKSKIALVIGFIFAIVYLVVHAGRAAILTFIIVIFFANSQLSEKKMKVKTWFIIGLVTVVSIVYLRPLLVSLTSLRDGFDAFMAAFTRRANDDAHSVTSAKEMLFRVTYYLEHKYISLEVALKSISTSRYSYDFFRDILAAAVSIFPSAILPFEKPNSIDTYNTLLITGTTSTGAIPPGGVAFGYYALGPIGVILFSTFVGVMGRKSECYFDSFDSSYMKILKTVNMFIWVDLFINGELREWTLRYFVFLCIMAAIFLNTSKRSYVDVK